MIEIKNECEDNDEDYCCLSTLVRDVPVTLHMTIHVTSDRLRCYLWGWQELRYLSMATATVVNSDPCCAISVQGYRYGSTSGNTLAVIFMVTHPSEIKI